MNDASPNPLVQGGVIREAKFLLKLIFKQTE